MQVDAFLHADSRPDLQKINYWQTLPVGSSEIDKAQNFAFGRNDLINVTPMYCCDLCANSNSLYNYFLSRSDYYYTYAEVTGVLSSDGVCNCCTALSANTS